MAGGKTKKNEKVTKHPKLAHLDKKNNEIAERRRKKRIFIVCLFPIILAFIYQDQLEQLQLGLREFFSEYYQNLSAKDFYDVTIYDNGASQNGTELTIPKENCSSYSLLNAYLNLNWNSQHCSKYAQCQIYNKNAKKIKKCSDITDSMWIVPYGKLFLFPSFGGHDKIVLEENLSGSSKNIVLESLEDSPRVFLLHNFFTQREGRELINSVESMVELETTSNQFKHGQIFILSSETSLASNLKKRAFKMLAIDDEYLDGYVEDIEIWRYKEGEMSNSRVDYIQLSGEEDEDDDSEGDVQYQTAYQKKIFGKKRSSLSKDHNYDPRKEKGSNRYATIIMYLNSVEEGGETLFHYVTADSDSESNNFPNTFRDTLRLLRDENKLDGIEPGSLVERAMVECRMKLAVKPQAAEAVLFYNQLVDGKLDYRTLHRGCPSASGTKWVAKLRIWNGDRPGKTSKKKQEGRVVNITLKNELSGDFDLYRNGKLNSILSGQKAKNLKCRVGDKVELKRNRKVYFTYIIPIDTENGFEYLINRETYAEQTEDSK